MKRSTEKPGLRLRSVAGLREEISLSIPESWMETLRSQAGKLDLPLEDFLVQHAGHIAAEAEAMARPQEVGDSPARLVLRDGLRESFRREADRCGLSIRVLLNRACQSAADAFDGRQYESRPAPVTLVPKRKAGQR